VGLLHDTIELSLALKAKPPKGQEPISAMVLTRFRHCYAFRP